MTVLLRCAICLGLCSVSFAQHTPRPCADFPIKTSDGKTIRISKYHGKVVMIVMMKTDCSPCHQMLETVSEWQKEWQPRGFQVLAFTIDAKDTNVVPYAERYRFPFPVAYLRSESAIKLADLNKTAHPWVPYVMFVDWKGDVRFQYAGNDPILSQGVQAIRGIADGLLHQAADKSGPQLKTVPAGKQ
jgi:peroxiredoxin